MPRSETFMDSFQRRVGAISRLGLGLSVDVYSPDIFALIRRLDAQRLHVGYLEIFKATTVALTAVRSRYPSIPLTFHGEGLWVTQPDFPQSLTLDEDVAETVRQLRTIGSHWLNHECASKQIAGYSFGTYLPPLYTEESAVVVAENISLVQEKLDAANDGAGPLFLLEMPPLTYFAAGTLPIPDFFRHVVDRVSCGLVLDIGHLWTVYRYGGVCKTRTLMDFVQDFINTFPMERVVEIHIAGIAPHESHPDAKWDDPHPTWIDAHAAPIPAVLFDVLEQVLDHPRLVSLRGVALEVDTKPIDVIVEEFREVRRRFEPKIQTIMAGAGGGLSSSNTMSNVGREKSPFCSRDRTRLHEEYRAYARVISGQAEPSGSVWERVLADRTGLNLYTDRYLPYEILTWGGALTEMFPETCREMALAGLPLSELVAWWFRDLRRHDRPYDFFLLKLDRMIEFVAERVPALSATAERERAMLQTAYIEANNVVVPAVESTR